MTEERVESAVACAISTLLDTKEVYKLLDEIVPKDWEPEDPILDSYDSPDHFRHEQLFWYLHQNGGLHVTFAECRKQGYGVILEQLNDVRIRLHTIRTFIAARQKRIAKHPAMKGYGEVSLLTDLRHLSLGGLRILQSAEVAVRWEGLKND